MRAMALVGCVISLICFVGFPSACLSQRADATMNDKPMIRYDANGIPNFIKGENLSASLDTDLFFRDLKKKNRYADIAFYFLDSQRALFKLTSARDEFVVKKITSVTMARKHIKLQQVFHDLPVWGMQVTIHLDKSNRVYCLQGHYQPISPHLNTRPAITREAACRQALRTRPHPLQWRIQQATAFIWAPSDADQRLVYIVTLIKNGIYRERCFVDAFDGSLLRCLSATPDNRRPPMSQHRRDLKSLQQ